MAGPNFDPAQELPDDQVPISVPVGTPNQLGGARVGPASNPDPVGSAQAAAAETADHEAAQRAWLTSHDANTGAPRDAAVEPPAAGVAPPQAPGAPAPAAPLPPGAPAAVPGIDASAAPAPPPGAPPVPGAPPPPAAAAPAHAGGHAAHGAHGAAPGDGLPAGSADLQRDIREGTADEQAAARKLGEAQDIAATQKSSAIQEQIDLRHQQAGELAAQQQYVHDRQSALDQEDAANLKVAKEKTIPDFWQSREGQLAGAAVTVGLSGAAGALLGTTHNAAQEAIQHNVDAYYGREKEKIDNLYKYAEMKGHLDDKMRAQYASELTDLMQRHAYTLDAAADRIQQVVAEGQGGIDKAKAGQAAAALKSQSAQELTAARGLDLHIYDAKSGRMKAQADLIRANADAAKARAEANKTKGDAALEKEIKPVSAEFDKDEMRLKGNARAPGLVMRQQDIREIGNNLRSAIASGDPQAATAAAIAAKEKISRLNTGAAPSGHVLEFLDSLTGDPQHAVEKMHKIMGDPKTSSQTLGGLVKLIDQSDEGALKQIDRERQNIVAKYIGPSGIARTAAQRQHVMGRLNGVFNQTTSRTDKGEVPRYAEGGAPEGGHAETPAAEPAATKTLKMPDGSLATFDATGKRIK